MIIKNVKLVNFRNYSDLDLKLSEGINIFYGNNAQGKTNIIESIFISAIGKSFRTNKDLELIKIGENISTIDVNYVDSNREGNIKINISDKKKVEVNGIPIKRLSEILGKVYVVLFTPDDINILKGTPANRRKFLNIMISQLRPIYMHTLNEYLKTLSQRNAYLKQIKFENKSEEMLDIWDSKLAELGIRIYLYRKEFIEKISEKIQKIHSKITNEKEKIEIFYSFECKNKDDYFNNLKNNRKSDIIKGSTNYGIHRDDFKININDKEISSYGSQGQHRTAILSLKISELQIIYDEVGEYPILLLDDFMSELDNERRINLLENINNNQVIITCTDKKFFEDISAKIYNVQNGKII
ncbi:MAG: DNA replication/repair protein RecF [Clostridia bacterium]|nr:DNA replication/repair protein RecF [Clostridia bacterium]